LLDSEIKDWTGFVDTCDMNGGTVADTDLRPSAVRKYQSRNMSKDSSNNNVTNKGQIHTIHKPEYSNSQCQTGLQSAYHQAAYFYAVGSHVRPSVNTYSSRHNLFT